MRFGVHDASIRIVMDMDAEADFRAMTQDSPPRIVIDMPTLAGKPAVKRSVMPQVIEDVRLEPLDGNLSRITFVLNQKALIRSAFMMPPEGRTPARLVLDMAPASDEQFAQRLGKPVGTLSVEAPKAVSTTTTTTDTKLPFAGVGGTKLGLIGQSQDALPLIVIDAGHGGQDSGATHNNVQEKNITLAVARALKTALEAKGGYRVQLTRDKDIFIRLNERVRIARQAGADLFVSVHADSAPEEGRSAQGASIYTVSDRASDAIAARLAASENQADVLAGVDLPDHAQDVADILVDLTMRDTVNQSRYFAKQIVRAFAKNNIPLLPSPHKQAGFVVLKAPDVPSVLIELGFVSNPIEAKKLDDQTYRAALAQSIAKGIDAWFSTRKR